MAAVHRPEDFPGGRGPIVAFVGRSNVGKSSLLNRLLGTTAANVSKTPGRTRGIYIYETSHGHDYADFPGVGFARVSKEERAGWGELVDSFFRGGRAALAVQLIDPRVPDSASDLEMRDYLASSGTESFAVATKWDRLSAVERARARRLLDERHANVIPVSSKTGEGIEALRREIRRRLEGSGDGSVRRRDHVEKHPEG